MIKTPKLNCNHFANRLPGQGLASKRPEHVGRAAWDAPWNPARVLSLSYCGATCYVARQPPPGVARASVGARSALRSVRLYNKGARCGAGVPPVSEGKDHSPDPAASAGRARPVRAARATADVPRPWDAADVWPGGSRRTSWSWRARWGRRSYRPAERLWPNGFERSWWAWWSAEPVSDGGLALVSCRRAGLRRRVPRLDDRVRVAPKRGNIGETHLYPATGGKTP